MSSHQMGLIGRKLGMTQIFDASGAAHGVTVLQVEPNTVVHARTGDKPALQLGYGSKRDATATKAELGIAKKNAGSEHAFKLIRQIRVPAEVADAQAAGARRVADGEAEAGSAPREHLVFGQSLTLSSVFAENEKVDVRGTSKGRGFAGVMKRHNFSGFKRSHGVHEYYRHGGSIGTRLTPGMTLKGVKMPGRLGGARSTVQNLRVVRLDAERNLLYVRGGVPGPVGGFVIVRKAVKRKVAKKK